MHRVQQHRTPLATARLRPHRAFVCLAVWTGLCRVWWKAAGEVKTAALPSRLLVVRLEKQTESDDGAGQAALTAFALFRGHNHACSSSASPRRLFLQRDRPPGQLVWALVTPLPSRASVLELHRLHGRLPQRHDGLHQEAQDGKLSTTASARRASRHTAGVAAVVVIAVARRGCCRVPSLFPAAATTTLLRLPAALPSATPARRSARRRAQFPQRSLLPPQPRERRHHDGRL